MFASLRIAFSDGISNTKTTSSIYTHTHYKL